jgi:hypothetical protein
MTLIEAYELLDLPEGTDIQQVRASFSEQYSEYRMQIDNAPTPNLRQRYEQNLALREEAFNLITGGASLDDSHDLPSSAPFQEKNSFNSEKPSKTAKTNHSKEEVNKMLLWDALALLGMHENSSLAQIKKAHFTQKTGLEAEILRTKIEGAKQAYREELNKLEQAWSVIDPWLQNRINQEKETTEQTKPKILKAISTSAERKKSFAIPVIIGGVLLLLISSWFYFSKEISTANTSAITNLNGANFKTEQNGDSISPQLIQKIEKTEPKEEKLNTELTRKNQESLLAKKGKEEEIEREKKLNLEETERENILAKETQRLLDTKKAEEEELERSKKLAENKQGKIDAKEEKKTTQIISARLSVLLRFSMKTFNSPK